MQKKYYNLIEAAKILGVSLGDLVHLIATTNHPSYIYYSGTGHWCQFDGIELIPFSGTVYAEGFFQLPLGDLIIVDAKNELPEVVLLLLADIWNCPRVYTGHAGDLELHPSLLRYFSNSSKEFMSFHLESRDPLRLEQVTLFDLPELRINDEPDTSLAKAEQPTNLDRLNHDIIFQDLAEAIAKEFFQENSRHPTKAKVVSILMKNHSELVGSLSSASIERRTRVTWKRSA